MSSVVCWMSLLVAPPRRYETCTIMHRVRDKGMREWMWEVQTEEDGDSGGEVTAVILAG